MLVFRDRLNRANGGIGADYTDGGAATSITSNAITFTASTHTFFQDNLTADDTKVYIQLKAVSVPAATGFIGLYIIGNGTNDGYNLGFDSGAARLRRVDAGVTTDLGASFTSPANGDVVTLTYDGTTDTVAAYYNGTLAASRSDATYNYSSWQAYWGGRGTDATIDDLEFGTLTLGTVTKSIGTSGRNYSTIQAWIDECPPYLTLSNTVYKGELYNDSEFTINSDTLFLVPSITTDATRYVILTVAAGQSFRDHVDAATSPLRYDVTKGVGLRVTGSYARIAYQTGSSNIRIERVQTYYDSSYSSSYYPAFTHVHLKDVLHESRRTANREFVDQTGGGTYAATNCIFVNMSLGYTAGQFAACGAGTEFTNCTIVIPSDVTSTGSTCFNDPCRVSNCAIFGYDTTFNGTLASYTGGNNATDEASAPGTGNQTSLTLADQFENVVSSTRDWRPKSTGALVNNGSRQQAYTGDLDIIGASRSTSTPTIGAREFVATGPRPVLSFGGKFLTSGGKILRL